MEKLDKAVQLFQGMPADVCVSNYWKDKHNIDLKKIVQKQMTVIIETSKSDGSVSPGSINKVLQILGMLLRDEKQQELIEMVQSWQPGDELDLSLIHKNSL